MNFEYLKGRNEVSIWLDDDDENRVVPDGYVHCHTVNETKSLIRFCEAEGINILVLDLDHDLGEYSSDGGDAIKLLDWLDETGRKYKCVLHTMNPVGRQNMQRIIDRMNSRK